MTDARHGWRKNAKDSSVVAIGEKTHRVIKCENVTIQDDLVSHMKKLELRESTTILQKMGYPSMYIPMIETCQLINLSKICKAQSIKMILGMV